MACTLTTPILLKQWALALPIIANEYGVPQTFFAENRNSYQPTRSWTWTNKLRLFFSIYSAGLAISKHVPQILLKIETTIN